MSFSSTSSASSSDIAPVALSESLKLFDADFGRKRVPIAIVNPKTGSPIQASVNHVAKLAEAKVIKEATKSGPQNVNFLISKPIRISAPPTPYTTWSTPSEIAARAASAKTYAELRAQAQRRRDTVAAIIRAEDERREREAAEAEAEREREREAEMDAALMRLLGVDF